VGRKDVSVADLRQTLRLNAERVNGRCDPADLPFDSTQDIHPLEAVFGQERAVRAIEFSLGMQSRGYNLFTAGPDGIGKTTIVESFLQRRAAQMPAPPDFVYVHNFSDPDRPIGIPLAAGQGPYFAEEVRQVVELASRELKATFESDSYARQRQELSQKIEAERNEILKALQQEAQQLGFALQMTPSGINSAPLIDGVVATEETFNTLTDERKAAIQAATKPLEQHVQERLLQMRGIEREAQQQLAALDAQVAAFAVEHLFEPLLQKYRQDMEAVQYLEAVRDDIKAERDAFRSTQPPPAIPGLPMQAPEPQALPKYQVNVLVTHDPNAGAPVISETHPTYYNLLGRIEYASQFGGMVTNHMQIKPGALAEANGGFLLLRLRDLLNTANAAAYDGLKRALHSECLRIENLNEAYGLVPTGGLRPEVIPLDVKVVLAGDSNLHGMLYRYDPDFRELFRVKADFEVDVPRTAENIVGVASVIRAQCDRGGLRHFDRSAIARLIEHSSRMVEDQRRLSANMGSFIDIVRQADYWAARAGADVVRAEHVAQALEEMDYRSSLLRDRIQQMIDEGSLFIDSAGERVGQINALSVYDLGDFMFGRPSRITCIVSAGRGTIVNVERETEMAGRIHNKGFLILRGFMAERFGQDKAMSLHASLAFEQLYGDIDGDSASSTELYVLLSALSGLPISQSIAVTGSVNQHGEVQPIGGAIAKIEGFYEVCLSRGLDGAQGVMIPRANVENLVLKPEVATAIAEGRFHVWAVSTIEEGIELLTGKAAGVRQADGSFPEGTVFRLVEDRLETFYHQQAQHRDGVPMDQSHPHPLTEPAETPPGVPPAPPPDPPIRV